MKTSPFDWKNPSGLKIYAECWSPDNSSSQTPKAVILLQHGLGEHLGRYAHVGEFFVSKNMVVLANDRAGHGRSEGKRGHIQKYEQTLDDIEKLHNEATRLFPKVPVFLYGHSMGGGIVLNYLLRRKNSSIKGVIATAPAIVPAFEPSKGAVFMGKLMRKIWGGYVQNNQLDVSKISRSAAVVEAYKSDKLVHSQLSAEMGIGLLEWGQFVLDYKGASPLPLLILHGDADGLTSFPSSEKFVKQLTGDVTFIPYKGLYHELHNEPEQQTVLGDIYAWMQSKL
jgi:acylglycerol lipase